MSLLEVARPMQLRQTSSLLEVEAVAAWLCNFGKASAAFEAPVCRRLGDGLSGGVENSLRAVTTFDPVCDVTAAHRPLI